MTELVMFLWQLKVEHLCDTTSEQAEREESRTINHLLNLSCWNCDELSIQPAKMKIHFWYISPNWQAELQIYVQQAGVEDCNKVRSLIKNTSLSFGALVIHSNSK